jgi:hypothetical protein
MIRHYFYSQQIKKFLVGFANVFAGLTVRSGLDGCGEIVSIEVPIVYGSKDRVVAAIQARNTQNQQYTLPSMAFYQTAIEMAPDRLKGVNQVDRRSILEQGGVFPDDVKTIKRVMAIPYNMEMELSIHASNTDQAFQILEQILMLFDYDMQIQFNDAPLDWTKITSIFLTGINNEEVYPTGTERRMIVWTLTFEMPIWLSPPMEIRNDIIASIRLRFGDLANLQIDQIDDDGDLVPFDNPYSETVITAATSIVDPTPDSDVPPVIDHFDPPAEDCPC